MQQRLNKQWENDGVEVDDVEYVVYVNHPTNKAIIHSAACGKFTKRRRDKTLNGYWSIVDTKLFVTIEKARDYANKTEKKNVDTCAFCIKL